MTSENVKLMGTAIVRKNSISLKVSIDMTSTEEGLSDTVTHRKHGYNFEYVVDQKRA